MSDGANLSMARTAASRAVDEAESDGDPVWAKGCDEIMDALDEVEAVRAAFGADDLQDVADATEGLIHALEEIRSDPKAAPRIQELADEALNAEL